MKVLVWMPIPTRVTGGHFIQLEKTTEHLRKHGIDSSFSTDGLIDPSAYDLVHGFAVKPHEIRQCITAGTPIVLSTIHVSSNYQYPAADQNLVTSSNRLVGRVRNGLSYFQSVVSGHSSEKVLTTVRRQYPKQIMWEMVSLLLPNSEMEAQQIKRDFDVSTPMRIVPNAVDPAVFYDRKLAGERDSVVYCGRIEPHKNQLGLIRALYGTKLKLVIVGPVHPDHERYYERCRREADSSVEFHANVPHDQLPQLYSKARVHALPSYFETTGLVSLEAALCGCNIVTTNRGYASEYFDDMAKYCDPANVNSIRTAVFEAFESKDSERLKERILSNYTWDHTAKATIDAYKQVLSWRTGNHRYHQVV